MPLRLDGWFHTHAHSHYSVKDALPAVSKMVSTAKSHKQPGLAVTDHGNMSGAVELYTEAKKLGVAPFPGSEFYVVHDRGDKKAKRHHLGLIANTTQGYKNLVAISTMSHANFYHKPLLDLSDLYEINARGLHEGVWLTTGCFFGFFQQALSVGDLTKARSVLETYDRCFPDHVLVELQHHNINDAEHDDQLLVLEAAQMAYTLGMRTIITQDAHYCDHADKPAHDALKRMVAWGDDGDDAVFPGDGFHLCNELWVKTRYPRDIWEDALEANKELLSTHSLSIPSLDSYHYNVPHVTDSDPVKKLAASVGDFLTQRGSDVTDPTDPYVDRFGEELEVIESSGMADYLLFVQQVTDWMRSKAIFFQTRGSASGSLVCWALGITQYDPLEWELRFERFLSKDRTKPPDIDLDVEDKRRQEVIDMLDQTYSVLQIGTYGTYGLNDEGGGSLFVSAMSKARKQGQPWVNFVQTVNDLPKDHRDALLKIDEEGVLTNYGVHAAGILVTTTDEELHDWVPSMYVASSKTTVSQYTMDEVESMGYVKLDLLGLRTMRLLRRTIELMGRDFGADLARDFDFIPLDDKPTFNLIRRGKTDGVFQLDGWTASRGCQEMQVRSLKDIIDILALYRPATINSGIKDAYLARKNGTEAMPKMHRIIEEQCVDTYMLPVFQEQVIGMIRGLGLGAEDLTKLLKAVKASNKTIGDAGVVIESYRAELKKLALISGFSAQDFKFFWNAIEGFAEYGFNKAHSVSYGVTAYRLAYLKRHHTLEFATALLETYANHDKEKDFLKAVRGQMGIRILRPDINVSGETYSLDSGHKAIRRGLSTIKGIGPKAAKEIVDKRPFADIQDLIDRTDNRSVTGGGNYSTTKQWDDLNGVLGKLRDAGVINSLK